MRTSTPRRRLAAAVCALAAATLAGFLGVGTAHAASAHPAPAAAQAPSTRTITVSRPMHVVGFDAAIAKAHGYTVRTSTRGQQYVAKAGSAAVTPANTVEGPCGDSWITYTAIGGRQAVVGTGYTINPDFGVPLGGIWHVAVVDNAGTGIVTSYPTSGSLAWSTTYVTRHSVTGYSYASVVPSSSWVLTDEGFTCHSGGPSANTTLR